MIRITGTIVGIALIVSGVISLSVIFNHYNYQSGIGVTAMLYAFPSVFLMFGGGLVYISMKQSGEPRGRD